MTKKDIYTWEMNYITTDVCLLKDEYIWVKKYMNDIVAMAQDKNTVENSLSDIDEITSDFLLQLDNMKTNIYSIRQTLGMEN